MKTTKIIGISVGAVAVIGFFVAVIASAPDNARNNPARAQQQDSHHSTPQNAVTRAPQIALDSLVDKPAPTFSLSDRDGKTYSTDSLRGKKIVLFFNEGLMCYPACWNQMASFPKDERFKELNAEVISIVVNPKEQWQKAVDKMPELGAATVVYDTNGTVSGQYGMLTTASSMHYGVLPGHSYVILDAGGIVRYVFDDAAMGINNDQLVEKLKSIS